MCGELYDTTADLIQVVTTAQAAAAKTAVSTASGWYVTLLAGEEVVRGSITLAGTVVLGTTTPATATNTCNVHLGESRIYMMSYLDATSTFDVNRSNTPTALDRFEIRAGGDYPPTRFPFQSKSMGKAIRQPFSAVR